jgi:hypothetical protein
LPLTIVNIFIGVLLAAASGCDTKGLTQQASQMFGATVGARDFSNSTDTDGDGIPDLKEIALGSDPDVADSDGNGISDGDEDSDGDGLSDAWESKLGFDSKISDSTSTLYADKSQKDGLNDGDKDMDNDGLANWYEARYEMNPVDGEDASGDADRDGFIALEEYPSYSPISDQSYPNSPSYARIYDVDSEIIGRTKSKTVRLVTTICFDDEQIAVSLDGEVAPSGNDFKSCTTAETGYEVTLAMTTEAVYPVYVWRKVAGILRRYPVKSSVVYDITAPKGTATLGAVTGVSITVNLSRPDFLDYAGIAVRAITGTTCDSISATDGRGISLKPLDKSFIDSSLTAGKNYCYKIFWYDSLQNSASTTITSVTALPTFLVYDNDIDTAGRTNSQTIRSTLSTCSGFSHVLVSTSSTAPVASDANFVACSAAEKAFITAPLTAQAAGLVSDAAVYLWGRNDTIVADAPVAANLVYDTLAPTGAMVAPLESATTTTVRLDITHPSSSDYAAIELFHEEGGSCAITGKDDTGATKVLEDSTAQAVDLGAGGTKDNFVFGPYGSGTNHCYRVYFRDSVGNESDIQITNAKTQQSLTGCVVAPVTTTAYQWYIGTTIEYTVTCTGTITAVSNTSMPSIFSLITPLPAADVVKVRGTGVSALALTTWALSLKGLPGNPDQDITGIKTEILDPATPANMPVYAISATATIADMTTLALASTITMPATYGGNPAAAILMGDAVTPVTTSNGFVAATETDIPLLKYSDSSVCDGVAYAYEFCSVTATYSRPVFTMAPKLYWNFTDYDQGSYYVRTKSYVNADGTKFYSGLRTSAITVANQVTEPLPVQSTVFIGKSELFDPTSWFNYVPTIALNENLSTRIKDVYAVGYSAFDGTKDQYAGTFDIDRAAGTPYSNSHWVDTVAEFHLSPATANTFTHDLVDTANGWLSIGSHNVFGGGGPDLTLSYISYAATTPRSTAINLTQLPVASSIKFTDGALTNRFTEGLIKKHGMAFVSKNGGIYELFVTKITMTASKAWIDKR